MSNTFAEIDQFSPQLSTDFLVYLHRQLSVTFNGTSPAANQPDKSSLDDPDNIENWFALLSAVNYSVPHSTAETLGLPADEQLAITILYGSAIAIALLGNLAVILVFLFGKRWDSDLSVYLANLAVSDIILSVFCMPFTMSQVVKHHWPFSEALCPLVMFLQLCSVLSSVYTLVAVGVDRYVFMSKPLEARFRRPRGLRVLSVIWLLAICLSSIQLGVVRCTDFHFNGATYKDCQEEWSDSDYRKTYTIAIALLTYFLPLTILIFTYNRIARILWQQRIPGERVPCVDVGLLPVDGDVETKRIRSKQRVVKMLLLVVVLFGVCWFPLHFLFLLMDFFPEALNNWRTAGDGVLFTYIFLAIHFVAMSSSFVNPLIYSFMSQNFRNDVRQIWRHGSASLQNRLSRLRGVSNKRDVYLDMDYSGHSQRYGAFLHTRRSRDWSLLIQKIFSHPTPSISACRRERQFALSASSREELSKAEMDGATYCSLTFERQDC
ncbi:putative Tachykinin-like peptides receptor 99D [Hypsibius exemplaris]|uniref:Tachykinin-like peptides receptor 99D n=1 Tax=Hypsibius exemplaris TaxID=2072580 RepID=A0A9X6NE90_HYPEX|nr:putative Tachykinin-like peptides receptor 99D [Hypsibius exemplaris]